MNRFEQIAQPLPIREEELRTLLAALPDVISRFDRDLRFLYISPAVERLTGLPAVHFIGRTHVEAGLSPELSARLCESLEKIFRTGHPDTVEFEFLSPVQGPRYLIGLGVPEYGASGQVVSALSIVRDITDRKRAEAAHRESEERFRAAFAQAPIGIVLTSPEGRILDANQAYFDMLGFRQEELAGQTSARFTHPDDMAATQTFLEELQREGKSSASLEKRYLHKDGRVIWARVSATMRRDPVGRPMQVIAIIEDVSEQKRAEQRDALLRRIDDATRALTETDEITQTVTRLVVEHLAVNRCAYADVTDDQGMFHLIGDYNRDVPSIVGHYTLDQFGAEFVRRMRADLPFLVEDAEIDPRVANVRASYHAARIRAVISVPVHKAGRFVAGMAVHQSTPRQWRSDEVELLRLVASRCWESVERTRVTRELREREQRLRLAQQVGRIGSFEWWIQEDAVVWTPELEALYGVPEGTFEGKLSDWNKRVVPEDAEGVIAGIQDCFAKRQAEYAYEFRAVLPNGSHRWLRGQAQFFYNADGKPVRMVGVNIDIDAPKRAETERKLLLQREQEARQTAELLNCVGPLLVSELDPQRLAQKVTDLATQVLGAEFGALFHNVLNEKGESYLLYTLSGVPHEAFANFPMPRSTAVFGPTFRGEGVVRSDDITKDPRYGKNAPNRGMPPGHLPVRSYLAAPVISRSGEVLGGLFFGHRETGIFTDQDEYIVRGIAAQSAIALDNARLFSQSQRAQAALQQSNEELRRANEDLNQFAYSASHDLQEPLRMVAVFSQLLQRKYQDQLDEQANEYLRFAVNGAKRMSMLIEDLLAYTQAVGPAREKATPVNASDVLARTLENLQRSIKNASATVEHGPLPVLLVTEVHLLQLFQNLIGNGLKYRSAEPPKIRIYAEPENGMWRLSVQDNGVGIAPEYHDQVFGIFRRLHSSSDYEGTGIGLAICQKIVERYGGRIWVESVGNGSGSTFHFTLPGAEEQPSASSAPR